MRFSSVHFSLVRSTTRGAALACALALAVGFAAPAFALVEEILIEAARGDFGDGAKWYFYIEVEGQSLPSSGTVTPPTGPGIPLTGGGEWLEFDESVGFASFALLQATYPAGDYDFDVDGETVTLNWNPTAPTGASGEPSVTITGPADGSTKQSSMPDVSYVLDCTNCRAAVFELFDVPTDGGLAQFDLFLPDQTPGSFPNPALFSSMSQEGLMTQLPDGLNEAEAIFGLVTFSEAGFDLPTSAPNFDYVELASVIAISQFSVGAANSTFTVDEILFEAAREDLGGGPGWHLFVEIEGEGLPATATVDPPTGPQMMLTSTGGGFELEFEDGPFTTFADLKSTYNTGNYLFTVGEETVTLGWDPDEPLGASGQPTLSITSPADGATISDTQPDTSFSFDCTNCKDLDLDLFDVPTDGMQASFGFGELGVSPPGSYTNPIPFSSLSSENAATELPAGENEAELVIGLADFSTESFDPPTNVPSFDYTVAGTVIAINTFTVPEPTSALLQVVALAAVVSIARRRVRARH
ncbi:MAG: hypothetical protein JRJ58_03385 [Deltaproteobacteria bacterium]|nr:hypothetical protein [Deltaproteobacteria bacterium]